MNSALLIVAILLAALILWLAAQISQSQKKSSALEAQLTELRRDLLSIPQTQSQSAGQIQSIGQSVSQRLESVTKALHDAVTTSAHIATQGQTAIAAELKNTREQLLQLQGPRRFHRQKIHRPQRRHARRRLDVRPVRKCLL